MHEMDAIDKVLKNTLKVMDESKYQIFEISEGARIEQAALDKQLKLIVEEMNETIEKVDHIEKEYKAARVRLSEVSRDFKHFTEEHIRVAYLKATEMQMELVVLREKEANLRERRNDLQQRMRNIEKTIERAESIVTQMNVILEYLSGDLSNVTRIIESAKNRQMLGLKIILAQEEERKRVAREIHDGIAQSMANLVLRTEITEKLLETQQYDSVKDEVVDLKDQVRAGLGEVRKIIFNLRPMTLDDLGLVPTIRKYVQDFEDKHSIRTEFNLLGKEIRLPSAIEIAIFRFIQEAFSNVVKHAFASYILVEVTYKKDEIKALFQDNGKGFAVDHVQTMMGEHVGLVGMQERIKLLNGTFHIESEIDVGTKLELSIPINIDEEG